MQNAVKPFVGTLKKQYRMHSSLSLVPRDLFYFGEALHDGRPDEYRDCAVSLFQVDGEGAGRESNDEEIETICGCLRGLNADETAAKERPGIMVITPYRQQEARLEEAIGRLRSGNEIANLGNVEVCTLDRCQGKEAEYVFISLVRSRATRFMDMPNRWNVALTRARKGMALVGNLDAYLQEARAARQEARYRRERPMMSLLARIVESYDRQRYAGAPGRGSRAA